MGKKGRGCFFRFETKIVGIEGNEHELKRKGMHDDLATMFNLFHPVRSCEANRCTTVVSKSQRLEVEKGVGGCRRIPDGTEISPVTLHATIVTRRGPRIRDPATVGGRCWEWECGDSRW